jgi:hypothetical protein
MSRLAALLAVTLLYAAPALAQQNKGALRSFNDWIIGCDNVRYCRAMGFVPDGWPKSPALVVAREGVGTSPPSVQLLWSDGLPGGALTLSADGQSLGTLSGDKEIMEPQWEWEGHRIMVPEVERKVLAALRTAKEITIAVAGSSEPPFAVSLKGASAALLFMDDVQKRVGTKTALARPGDRDPATIPAPPKLPPLPPTPKIAAKPFDKEAPQAVRRLFLSEAAKACDLEADEARKASAVFAARLSANQVLYGMQCWRAAYNFGTAFYVLREGQGGGASRAIFPDPVDRARPEVSEYPHVLSNAEFEEETMDVTTFHKGRGIGDCGTSQSWRWTGARFEPTSATSMSECRGFSEETWLRLYRVDDPKKEKSQ